DGGEGVPRRLTRAVVLGSQARARGLEAGEPAAETEEGVTLRQLVEQVHLLDQADRVVKGQQQHPEAEIPLRRDLRSDVGGKLHRRRVPRAPKVMLGKP